jgi:VWFA-related protein
LRLATFLLVVVVAASVVLPSTASSTSIDQDIRIDVATNAHVRVENQFGAIVASVWKQKYVSVSASIQGSVPFKRSPIVIDNRSNRLTISVVRTPVDPAVGIDLVVKLPESVHAEVTTGSGAINLSGNPASASLRSSSGDIRTELSNPLNADINVRSAFGEIRSALDAPLTGGGHALQTRVGTGENVLRINTDRGSINLELASAQSDVAATDAGPPRLTGSEASSPGAGTPAGSSEAEEVSEGDIVRVDSQLTTLNVSVVDRTTSRGVMGLSQKEFNLFEDGVEQDIVQFESSAAPFDLILLIDLSGSTRDKVKLIRAAAQRFVNASRPSDRIAIISFAGQATLISPLTLDRELLRQRVNAIDTVSGDTKVYDATEFALKQVPPGTINSRRTAIVLMSDGLDGAMEGVQGNGSQLSYSELINHVREFDGVLYTMWLNTEYEAMSPLDTQPEAFDQGHQRMNQMAEVGGGVFYEVDRLEDLAGAYERVVADLGTVYSLAYRPSNKTRDGKWRAIRVNIARPSAVARGKHGYYAN